MRKEFRIIYKEQLQRWTVRIYLDEFLWIDLEVESLNREAAQGEAATPT